jgi:hypothetical protein
VRETMLNHLITKPGLPLMLITMAVVAFLQSVDAQSATGVTITGKVCDAGSKQGIPNLEVKLTSPKGSKGTVRLVSTGQGGEFWFKDLERNQYLLDVSQGVNLLFRDVVDAKKGDVTRIIALRRRQ